MNKNFKHLILLVLAIFSVAAVLLCGCTGLTNQIVGKWEPVYGYVIYGDYTPYMEFYDDGTFEFSDSSGNLTIGTWTNPDGNLYILAINGAEGQYAYEIYESATGDPIIEIGRMEFTKISK